jgi:23S rRNA (cytosine1962-C5)-methyltransferase
MSFLGRKANGARWQQRMRTERPGGRSQDARPSAPTQPVATTGEPGIWLDAGRERSLERRHPWIFSGSIRALVGEAESGDTLPVMASDGRFLAWAGYSPKSQIRARVWSFSRDERPDRDWFHRRLERAVARRAALAINSNAMRLVHAESDGLPGIVVDRYGDVLVVQLLSAAADRHRPAIVEGLVEVTGCTQVYERSDAEVRALEGLGPACGPLSGDAPGSIEIVENGVRFLVDVREGHKTGFYLDQRESRAFVQATASGCEVLNCFSYTGGFALAALAGGARSVLSLETSGPALAGARENARLNGFADARAVWEEADVFQALRQLRDQQRSFDLIVLDPPKFAPTARQAEAASRGYKDINLNALRLLRPGGRLATFSCSGGISAELFQKIVAGAAADAGVEASIERRFQAGSDHPALLAFPEGEYLKGLLLRRW